LINYIYYQKYKTFVTSYFKASNILNKNYDVRLLYNETRLDGSAYLNGMIISTYLYLSSLGSRRGSDRMVAMIYNYLCDQRPSPQSCEFESFSARGVLNIILCH